MVIGNFLLWISLRIFNVKFLLIDGDNYCCSILSFEIPFFVTTLSFLSSVFPDIVIWDILLFAILVSRCLYHWKEKCIDVIFYFTSYEDGLISDPYPCRHAPLNIINTVAPLDYKFLRTKEKNKKVNSEQRVKTKLKWILLGICKIKEQKKRLKIT